MVPTRRRPNRPPVRAVNFWGKFAFRIKVCYCMGGVITMSKYYWQRGDSAVAYIYTARQLSKRLKTSCANVNHKKYTW